MLACLPYTISRFCISTCHTNISNSVEHCYISTFLHIHTLFQAGSFIFTSHVVFKVHQYLFFSSKIAYYTIPCNIIFFSLILFHQSLLYTVSQHTPGIFMSDLPRYCTHIIIHKTLHGQ